MANLKSSKKRVLTNRKATERNKATRSELKTAIKKVRVAVDEGNKEEAELAARDASKMLDRAVTKGAIHKNQAANRKSAVQKLVNTLG